jgi:DNA mismatch repair protein MutS
MMAQFLEIKAAYDDALLFYRMGDFYELFFDDAVQAAAALDIALTKRGKHLGEDIPMCGVPAHSYEPYLLKLIRSGFKVAVCEQLEDPAEAKKRGAKSVVQRGVVRVVTPGTLTEDSLLDARAHNYLACLVDVNKGYGLAWVDVSTGDFAAQLLSESDVAAALARLNPGELLVPDSLAVSGALAEVLKDLPSAISPLPRSRFSPQNGELRLKEVFQVADLSGFGDFSRAEITAAGAILDYVNLTQKGKMPRLSKPRQVQAQDVMAIDAATRRSLEITQTQSGSRKGSLLSCIDRTITGAGARQLAQDLAAPLMDPAAITRRLDAVHICLAVPMFRADVRAALASCPDIFRALARLTAGRGGPRDLAAIRDAVSQFPVMRENFVHLGQHLSASQETIPELLQSQEKALAGFGEVHHTLDAALEAEPPLQARDGGFVKAGYAPELDTLRQLSTESRRLISALQSQYQDMTGVQALKVKHNNVIGYYIEVTNKNADKLMNVSPFIHRQTLANAVRFSTPDLADLEHKLQGASEKAKALELDIFNQLVSTVLAVQEQLEQAGKALARLDVCAALAELADQEQWTRPEVDTSLHFYVQDGRHPVVEQAMQRAAATGDTQGSSQFVANSCKLDQGVDGRLWLLTGPNMAGKSTFLRQNALIAILAQMGAYVPARHAHVGVVDRLFSRVGAADDLARGRSTFMVEMVETAAILNQATDRSLVILDEIGRGTATYDGVSIAWATVEHLHNVNRCRALFATHYHELTALSSTLAHLTLHAMKVQEWEGKVVFLHEVAAGAADRSYGIHVARLAGLPRKVISRAEQVLSRLQAAGMGQADSLPLFAHSGSMADAVEATDAIEADPYAAEKTALFDAVSDLNPDDLSPKQALEALYALKAHLAEAQ